MDKEGAAPLVAAMRLLLGLVDAGASLRGGLVEGGIGFAGQLRLVALDGKHIIAAAIADGLGHASMAMQGVARDGQVLERQQFQGFDRRFGLAALLRRPLGQTS